MAINSLRPAVQSMGLDLGAPRRESLSVLRLLDTGSKDKPDSRVVSFVFSDNSVDRYGDTIDQRGWVLDSYRANPVVLFGHNDKQATNVVGKVLNLRVEGNRLIGDVEFAAADVNPEADVVFRLVKGGFLNCVSVGFQPLEWSFSNDKSRPGGIDFKKQELLELSIVPVPANANAVAQSRSAGAGQEYAGLMAAFASRESNSRPGVVLRSAPRVENRSTAVDRRLTGGFDGFGSYLRALASASSPNIARSEVDHRLVRAPMGANLGDPTSGGFLVPPQFVEELVGSLYGDSALLPYIQPLATARNLSDVRLPAVDEKSRADGSRFGGARAWWGAEADTIPDSLPHMRGLALSAKKLFAAVVVTNELMADAKLLETLVRSVFAAEMAFKLDQAIFAGTGAGVPLGVLNSPAAITVARAGQASGSVTEDNIVQMFARLPAPSRRRAVWLVHEDLEAGLGSGISPTIYRPAGADGSEYACLYGRPVIPVEQATAPGGRGDLVLCDLSQYLLMLGGGPEGVLSAHVRFLNDEAVFRFVWRLDGMPKWATPITPYSGGITKSPFVVLGGS
ncbi:phage major capsid protein [Xanthobacter aminoxidans]|uniref:phage major capsid protein n=1 Tax=Xanthobacter aminoxidans TaxID=186280 RepID=UPI002023085F|nr:phage major capsid protein [Xanthobacter aminoxidans]MCL8382481.1 phage major capsid protein [Xanthobacter aminoxidans]